MARLVSNRLTAASVVIAGLVLAATAAASRVDLRTASPADQARATERSFFRADVVSDTASRRSGSATASIAALGASEATGFATAGEFAEAPANSWVTGTNRAVRSIYLRLRELTPAIAGHAYNGAEPGSTMSALAGQAAHVPPGTDLVTIQMGTNDACGTRPDPTRPDLRRSAPSSKPR